MRRNQSCLTKRLGSVQRREVVLEDSYHVITVDNEKQQVAAEVRTFVEQFRVQRKQRAFG
jgi:esterase/lipase